MKNTFRKQEIHFKEVAHCLINSYNCLQLRHKNFYHKLIKLMRTYNNFKFIFPFLNYLYTHIVSVYLTLSIPFMSFVYTVPGVEFSYIHLFIYVWKTPDILLQMVLYTYIKYLCIKIYFMHTHLHKSNGISHLSWGPVPIRPQEDYQLFLQLSRENRKVFRTNTLTAK